MSDYLKRETVGVVYWLGALRLMKKCTALYCSVLLCNCSVLLSTALYCSLLLSTAALYCTVTALYCCLLLSTALYCCSVLLCNCSVLLATALYCSRCDPFLMLSMRGYFRKHATAKLLIQVPTLAITRPCAPKHDIWNMTLSVGHFKTFSAAKPETLWLNNIMQRFWKNSTVELLFQENLRISTWHRYRGSMRAPPECEASAVSLCKPAQYVPRLRVLSN
jgi:hypothetical protein